MERRNIFPTTIKYSRIERVTFRNGKKEYVLTGDGVSDCFTLVLNPDRLLFNEKKISKRKNVANVSSLEDVLAWFDKHKIVGALDELGLIVGGANDGRIDNSLNLSWKLRFNWFT